MAVNEEFGYLPLADPEFLRIAQALERISTAVGADITALAVQKAAEAAASALVAEGYAVGKQNGDDVSSGTYYQYNSKYFADNCSSIINAQLSNIQNAIDRADDAVENLEKQAGYAWFEVDLSDGQMYVTVIQAIDNSISFSVQEETGELLVTLRE